MKHSLLFSIVSALILTSCSASDMFDSNKQTATQTSEPTASPSSEEVTTAGASSVSDSSENASSNNADIEILDEKKAEGYSFDLKVDYVELDGRFFDCYINKPILFDNKEIPYKDFLSYKSPYDEYLTMFYDDHSGKFGISDTAAFAIRYACENDIEYLDFPIEYDTYTLYDAWEYARMTFPNLPLVTLYSQLDFNDNGYYRIHFTKALRDVARSPETLEIAKEIVAGIPSSCETQAQKAYYLYDWVCKNVVYDTFHTTGREGKVNGAPQAAYGALVEKRAVCDGIAGAIQLLYSIAGIDCGKVDAYDYQGGAGHVWNVAEIDHEIWDFDATWDIHRFYENKDDKISEEKGSGYYEWFGVERTAKTIQLDINDMMSSMGIFTEAEYTPSSPVNLSYDIVVSTVPGTFDDTIYLNGKEVDEMPYDFILDQTDNGNLVSIKFNNSLALADYWSIFNDSSSDIINDDFWGYPDTELLSIQLYPKDYYNE